MSYLSCCTTSNMNNCCSEAESSRKPKAAKLGDGGHCAAEQHEDKTGTHRTCEPAELVINLQLRVTAEED